VESPIIGGQTKEAWVPILSYLRFALNAEADRSAFELDLSEMSSLAAAQPGFRWAEVARSVAEESVYIVVSEWDDVEDVRAWEHIEEHEGVMARWETKYREPFVHRRFAPWIRPENP
jgi:heme-degrading monooxygenase HmoA